MGIEIGPEGNIWYVNGPNNSVFKVVPGVSGIEEEDAFAIAPYPNPANDQLTLRFDRIISANVLITELSGKVLFNTVISGTEATLDVSGLPSGMFLVRLQDDQGAVSTAPLSIQR